MNFEIKHYKNGFLMNRKNKILHYFLFFIYTVPMFFFIKFVLSEINKKEINTFATIILILTYSHLFIFCCWRYIYLTLPIKITKNGHIATNFLLLFNIHKNIGTISYLYIKKYHHKKTPQWIYYNLYLQGELNDHLIVFEAKTKECEDIANALKLDLYLLDTTHKKSSPHLVKWQNTSF